MIEDKKLDTPVEEKPEVKPEPKKQETPKVAPKAEVKPDPKKVEAPKKKTFTL